MSENATLFGACRVYLWSSATAGCSAPWPLAPWPHVLTIDIEQGGMVITEVFPLFISAARTMPSEAASDATMIAAGGLFLRFISCSSLAATDFGPRTRPAADRAASSRRVQRERGLISSNHRLGEHAFLAPWT